MRVRRLIKRKGVHWRKLDQLLRNLSQWWPISRMVKKKKKVIGARKILHASSLISIPRHAVPRVWPTSRTSPSAFLHLPLRPDINATGRLTLEKETEHQRHTHRSAKKSATTGCLVISPKSLIIEVAVSKTSTSRASMKGKDDRGLIWEKKDPRSWRINQRTS